MSHLTAARGDPVFPGKNMLAPRGGVLKKSDSVMVHSRPMGNTMHFVNCALLGRLAKKKKSRNDLQLLLLIYNL